MKLKVINFHLLKIYLKVWFHLAKLRFIDQIVNTRLGGLFFILGKFTRLLFQTFFLFILLRQTHQLVGYTFYQTLFILSLLNLSSTLIQMMLRGVYLFRDHIINGTFDFFLLNPLNELFYSLFSYFDPLDFFMLIPSLTFLFFVWFKLDLSFTLTHFFILISFLLIAFIFALSWHILAISFGIKFFEVDNLILIYRDLEKMGRFPIEIYNHIWQFILTYLTPTAVMATIPVKVLLGKQPFLPSFSLSFVLTGSSLILSLFLWRFSLRSYSSASS